MVKKKISIVIPLYNEENNIQLIYTTILTILEHITEYEYEFIFINDGSNDNSWSIIKNLTVSSASVKAINFSKNFGHQIALSAGYNHAKGDAIISMDADMQHPPEIIPAMIKAWQEGFDIVYIKNKTRKDSFFKKITALGYYRILELISEIKIPRNVADFRLIDKKVLSIINQSEEKARYLRGMVAWTGFKHTVIECSFAKRHSGVPGYTWNKMFKLALDGVIGFSTSPFRFIVLLGTHYNRFRVMHLYLFSYKRTLFFWKIPPLYLDHYNALLLYWNPTILHSTTRRANRKNL